MSSKQQLWQQIQQRWPELARDLKEINRVFGKPERVEVKRWPGN